MNITSKVPLPVKGSGSSPNIWFLGLTQVCYPNGTSIGSAVFAQLTHVPNTNKHREKQTDRQTTLRTTHVATGHIYALGAGDAA